MDNKNSRVFFFFIEELVFRMLLYHGGKLVKRKKSTPRVVGTMSPNFEESLTFDVPQAEIDNVTFVVVLCASTLVRRVSLEHRSQLSWKLSIFNERIFQRQRAVSSMVEESVAREWRCDFDLKPDFFSEAVG